jgi:hypothetical protein
MTKTDIKAVAAFLLTIAACITLQNAYPRKIKKGERDEESAKKRSAVQVADVKVDDDCNACKDMLDTVKHYDKHVIVYDFKYTSWRKRIEEDPSCFVHDLTGKSITTHRDLPPSLFTFNTHQLQKLYTTRQAVVQSK